MNNLTQISEDLTRLLNAKSAIISAISAKGITVPQGATLDQLSGLINNISTGGTILTTGTFNSSNTTGPSGYLAQSTYTLTPGVGQAFNSVTIDLGITGGTFMANQLARGQSILGVNGAAYVKSDAASVVTAGIPMSGTAPCGLTIKYWGAGVTSYTASNLTTLSISAGHDMSGSQASFKPQLNTPFFIEPMDIDEWAITIGQIPNNIEFIASSGSCIIGVAKSSRVGTLTINEY